MVVNYGSSGGSVSVSANNCRLISNNTCATHPTACSNFLTMSVINAVADAPAEGSHAFASDWISWFNPWNSGLKIPANDYPDSSNGVLYYR